MPLYESGETSLVYGTSFSSDYFAILYSDHGG